MMHSLAQRASTLSSYVTTIFVTVGIIVSILTVLIPTAPIKSLRLKNVKPNVALKNTRNFGGSKNKPKENARFKFDLVADFNDLVDWNTKQIFTYIYIDFDDDHSDSKMVIWDKILNDKSKMYLNYKNLKSKYSVWDYVPTLEGRNGTLKLGYNIQPYVGPLTFGEIDLNQTVLL